MGKENFINWLEVTTSLAPKTIRAYAGAINTISKGLEKYGHMEGSLYSLQNSTELETLVLKYFEILESTQKDSRGNKMYSNAFNYYKKYLEKNYHR